MNIKGVTQLVYDATIPERDGKIPFEELSDFDRLIYELTYCCFAPLKSANGKSWETAKTSQENLAYHTYGSFLAFMPDTGKPSTPPFRNCGIGSMRTSWNMTSLMTSLTSVPIPTCSPAVKITILKPKA